MDRQRWGSFTARSQPLLAVALLLGVLAVQCLSVLPPVWFDAVLAVTAIGAAWRFPALRLPAASVLAFAWCAWRADVALDARLPRALDGSDIAVVGSVTGLPLTRTGSTRFSFHIEQAQVDGAAVALRGTARLSWYSELPEGFAPCSRWRLLLRLKRPRGLINPGGFDFERYALERGIVATGYVRDEGPNERIGANAFCIDRLRSELSGAIAARVEDRHDAHLLQAFAVGDTRGLDGDDWEIARANGVPHLLAISGFHIGVAALLGVLLTRIVWWLFPGLALRLPLPLAQAPAALATALFYGTLAGNSLPTVRTLVMIAVVAIAQLSRRASGSAQSLALAMIAILLFDPLAVLSAGFWLSFVGVGFLILSLRSERGFVGMLRELGVGQCVMTVTLLPLTVWFFGQASLVGALSNLIAIPFVTLVIVPLALLGLLALLIAPPLAGAVLILGGWLVHAQWWLWDAMARWPGAHWYLPEVAPWAMLLAMIGAAWLVLPRGLPLRALGVLLFLPLIWPTRPTPAPGEFEVFFLDVGQGLSVFVRTQNHALLFDAGARYPSDFDLGEAAILPALRALGASDLDMLIVSHADNDHAGGAPAVARAYPDAQRFGGEPERSPIPMQACLSGQAWQWDGVSLRVFNPISVGEPAGKGNDRSCVVLIEGRNARLLLTGDMSSQIEQRIGKQIGPGAPLLLQVPHHGSRSASGAAFIAALRPRLAVVSAGWLSRFGHPHPEVVQRYADASVALVNTADAGAVRVTFSRATEQFDVVRERDRQRRYWRE